MAKYTSIGGQALIEGIMMKSPEKTALAVRTPDKSIDITYLSQKGVRQRYRILRLPLLRGVAGFVESMIQGYKAMMLSADKSGFADIEEENGIDAQDDDSIRGLKRQERLLVLKHMIASHHGKQEYGAIAKPCVAEAMALHIIDLLDSRMEIFEEEMVNVQPGERTQSGNYALDNVHVYRPTWAKVRE